MCNKNDEDKFLLFGVFVQWGMRLVVRYNATPNTKKKILLICFIRNSAMKFKSNWIWSSVSTECSVISEVLSSSHDLKLRNRLSSKYTTIDKQYGLRSTNTKTQSIHQPISPYLNYAIKRKMLDDEYG